MKFNDFQQHSGQESRTPAPPAYCQLEKGMSTKFLKSESRLALSWYLVESCQDWFGMMIDVVSFESG